MSQKSDKTETLTVFDVAEILDRSPQTVRRWIREGYIKAARLGREYRISKTDLNEWWKSRGGGVLFPDVDDQADNEGGGAK